jgi:hypothetical protein
MTVQMPYIPPNVYLLADNLDAALAAGEDIMKAVLVWESGAAHDGETIARTRAAQRAVLQNVRTLEQVLIARVLKSRERSEEIAKRDTRFATVARLYNAGTAVLIEAVGDFGKHSAIDFENGGDGVAYLRSRGQIAEDAPGPAEGQTFKFGDGLLIAGRIRLGTLLDLVAMYLDALETHFDLFSDLLVEPDLLPGEIDVDASAAGETEPDTVGAIAPTRDHVETADDAESEVLSDETDSLRDALLEVRNMVALDQR